MDSINFDTLDFRMNKTVRAYVLIFRFFSNLYTCLYFVVFFIIKVTLYVYLFLNFFSFFSFNQKFRLFASQEHVLISDLWVKQDCKMNFNPWPRAKAIKTLVLKEF